MRRRLLVMNGQRVLQSEQGGQWQVDKVERAAALKPGIYNLYLAMPADRAKVHEGLILHVDQEHVFQQVGKAYVAHDRTAFYRLPEVGQAKRIGYDGAKAIVADASLAKARKLSR